LGRIQATLHELHADQKRALALRWDARGGEWRQNGGGRFKAVRCGRRWGKSVLGADWLGDGAVKGYPCGFFAPDYKRLTEIYVELKEMLAPVTAAASKTDGIIRTINGGRIDFWTLDDENAGRSRKYKRVVLDEAAFTKPGKMMDTWKKAIVPTLFDYSGAALVASNTNGVDPDNFLWQICNQPEHGFIEYHAPTVNNPTIPMLMPGESESSRVARRLAEIERIRKREHPLVFRQEYEAEFVDFSGVAFFGLEKLLDDPSFENNQWNNRNPVAWPDRCTAVYAVIDSATKTGSGNDGTAVTYWALRPHHPNPLVLLDWDIVQIEGGLLIHWLPSVIQNCEAYARQCGAVNGSIGVFIEDKDSGQVLLQQAANAGMPATPIPSEFTAMGKDGRALSVSGYVYRGEVHISGPAFEKTVVFKDASRNHLVSQVTSFRVGDKEAAKRPDDLLDSFVYGVAMGLGNGEGF